MDHLFHKNLLQEKHNLEWQLAQANLKIKNLEEQLKKLSLDEKVKQGTNLGQVKKNFPPGYGMVNPITGEPIQPKNPAVPSPENFEYPLSPIPTTPLGGDGTPITPPSVTPPSIPSRPRKPTYGLSPAEPSDEPGYYNPNQPEE